MFRNDSFKIPKGWKKVMIGDVCNVFSGYAFKSKDYSKNGVPLIKIGNIKDGSVFVDTDNAHIPEKYLELNNIDRYVLKPGDILIALSGATTGKIGVVRSNIRKAFLNQRVGKIEVKMPGEIDNGFLSMVIRTSNFKEEIYSNILRSAQGNISPSKVEKVVIPLPPLYEQRNIAHILSTIQQAIEATDKVITAAQELKKSLMQHLFTYGPVSLEEAEQVPLKETEIGVIPEHWNVVKLGKLLTKTQYGLSIRGSEKGSYPILRMNNLGEGKVHYNDLQYVELGENELNKYKLDNGDLLFNRTNSYDLVGKVSIFDRNETYVFASYLIRLKVDDFVLLPQFLNMYLNWGHTQQRMKMLASRGASQSNISATKIKGLNIGLPPLSEQEDIVNIINAVDKKIDYEEKHKNNLQSLFNSMLHHLMTGKLRVKDLDLNIPEEVAQ